MNEQKFIRKLSCAVAPVSTNLLKVRFCTVQYRCIFVLIIGTLLCVICTLLRELDNKYLYVPFDRLTQTGESPTQDSRAQLALHFCDKNIFLFISLLQGEETSANIVFLVYVCMYVCMYVCIYIYIYLFGVIFRVRIVFRNTVVGD